MIEVNLFSVSSADHRAMVGRCVSRSRVSLELLGVSVMEYIKTFMKSNFDTVKAALPESVVELIESDVAITTKDFMSIQYFLGEAGYRIWIWNVADDEENASGVPDGGVLEYNIIDNNFIQSDYPTVTKYVPAPGSNIVEVLATVVSQCGLFNSDRFRGIKNPIKSLTDQLETEKKMSGNINANIITKVYQLLGEMGIEVFCAASEI